MATKFSKATLNNLEVKEKTYEIYDSKITGLFIRVYASGRKKYMVEYARKRKETIGTVGMMTLEGAREEATRLILLAKENGGNLPKHDPKPGTLSLKAFIDDHYANWMTQHRKNYEKDLSTLRSAFKPLMDQALDEITYKQLDDLRTRWLSSGNKASTVNRKITALKGLYARALEWQDISTSPLADMADLPVDENKNPRYLSKDEEQRLFALLDAREYKMKLERESANRWRQQRNRPLLPDLAKRAYADHLKPMVIALLLTGVRRGELFNLKWKDVSFPTGHLTATYTKNGKSRNIPLHPTLEEALKAWCPEPPSDDSYVFPGSNGGRMTDIKTAFNKVIEDAKIANFRLHDLRHTFASNLVMRGIPLNTVRELLGHGDIKMTLRYAHLSHDNLARAISVL
ncbi:MULTISPECIES: site-specific integrase [Pseudomonas putida group]|uniref:site-specific integrase n=1 Tax=Pseudomonas putida group TaxID=136845 RepID=UPI00064C5D60|nr:site-specific integrase [Pseudomonas putida]